jgi:SAM-dependent methyltransferase
MNKRALEERVGGLVAAVPHQTVVDLGCGPGRYVTALPAFKTYRGYDISPRLLAEAERLYADRADVTFTSRSIFDGAPYKRPVDVLLSIDTSRHYRDPLGLLRYIVAHWPARHYLFSILYGETAADLLNVRHISRAELDAGVPELGRLVAEYDEDLRPSYGLNVRYVLLARPEATA